MHADEAAVDGLLSGLLAGTAMTLVLILSALTIGRTPAWLLERFAPSQVGNWLTGGLLHLGVSGVYGIGYGLLASGLPRGWRGRIPGWLLGLTYGLVLLLVAKLILLPGSGSPLRQIPMAHFALAHGIYGLVLGLTCNPGSERPRRSVG